MSIIQALLERIHNYLDETQMTESRFGRKVLNDTSFISDLRAGRSPNARTIEKVDAFLLVRGKST